MTTATNIHPAELERLLVDDPTTRIIDVRSGGEFETAHISGSFNVPLDLLAEHRDDLAHIDHPVVLVCQSGGRATTAHHHLGDAGKSNLKVLSGGMNAWQKAGHDVVRGEERWELERQVRLVAGGIVFSSILASLRFPAARFVAGGIGFGLVFAAVSNTCAMGLALSKLPYNSGPKCDIDGVLRDMRTIEAPAA